MDTNLGDTLLPCTCFFFRARRTLMQTTTYKGQLDPLPSFTNVNDLAKAAAEAVIVSAIDEIPGSQIVGVGLQIYKLATDPLGELKKRCDDAGGWVPDMFNWDTVNGVSQPWWEGLGGRGFSIVSGDRPDCASPYAPMYFPCVQQIGPSNLCGCRVCVCETQAACELPST